MRYFIIAMHYNQFSRYCDQNRIKPADARYVTNISELRGLERIQTPSYKVVLLDYNFNSPDWEPLRYQYEILKQRQEAHEDEKNIE